MGGLVGGGMVKGVVIEVHCLVGHFEAFFGRPWRVVAVMPPFFGFREAR